jgi:aminoglycoside phosphotransferase (APT) family kinase protein
VDDPLDDGGLRRAVATARPGVAVRSRPSSRPDEAVLVGGGEVFRLPLAPSAVARAAVLVEALPRLRPLLPVAVPLPRWAGVLPDGATPFTVERRLPGVPPRTLDGIARGQVEGVVAGLLAVPPREAEQWGVPVLGDPGGDARVLLHGALGLGALLADPHTGLLTGVVDWDLHLGPRHLAVQADLAALL